MEYLLDSGIVMGDNMNFPLIFIVVLKGREYLLHSRDNKSEAYSENSSNLPKTTQCCPSPSLCLWTTILRVVYPEGLCKQTVLFTFLQLPSSFLFFFKALIYFPDFGLPLAILASHA